MRYNLILTVDDPSAFRLLEPEMRDQKRERSSIRLQKKEKKTIIDITAEDAVALRASADSIIQLLKVYEKMGQAK